MYQTKKGNQWYFGMRTHIGVDSQTKRIHSVAANVHDSQVLPELLHGQETRVWGDAAYSGQRDVIRQHAPRAKSFVQAKAHRHQPLRETEPARNRTKSNMRSWSSSKSLDGPKSGIVGWRRTTIGYSSVAAWRICMWRGGALGGGRRGCVSGG